MFDPGDELPLEFGRTRIKHNHTVGAVGQVEWRDLGGHQYSGIFTGATKARADFYIIFNKRSEGRICTWLHS